MIYTVDEKDKAVPLEGVPRWSGGAPVPTVYSDEHDTVVSFALQHSVDPHVDDYGFVRFHLRRANMFGAPNDEAFEGHPLADRGVDYQGAYRIEESSWVRQLERMNRVHPNHDPKCYDRLTHYVLVFHDSVFECVAGSYIVKVVVGPIFSLVTEIDIFSERVAKLRMI